ncbi:hypothetical protein [Rhizobium freirei]|uniref:hypothetical protein n=1 Tax=Rhizobium freirei TaxID=1353277 RepID=UPI0003A3EEAD|nr:hypothetical protein [Rhizobium freirei]
MSQVFAFVVLGCAIVLLQTHDTSDHRFAFTRPAVAVSDKQPSNGAHIGRRSN